MRTVDDLLWAVIEREGGIADVGDGAGVTRFGQTPGWLDTFGYPPPTTAVEALDNYRRWLHDTGLLAVCEPVDPLAECVVDWAVHAGHPRAIRSLQAVLGVRPDGVLGPLTRAALARADRRRLACYVVADRVRHFGRLLSREAETRRFAAGWANRIAAFVEALA
ncbi:MAG: hypothetical protein OEW98_00275 [Betaproteobacteria bacterium]|nr:hypothetical protein [Betaproteobacteria bacterium]